MSKVIVAKLALVILLVSPGYVYSQYIHICLFCVAYTYMLYLNVHRSVLLDHSVLFTFECYLYSNLVMYCGHIQDPKPQRLQTYATRF